ncbi:MAG: hypothetical protein QNJ68_09825 [Microcoleaceae cyanobacterium MO_207.B10]|nr:hypothetical protein [Microcoleaceae cyanobacterium MO_207.B10]
MNTYYIVGGVGTVGTVGSVGKLGGWEMKTAVRFIPYPKILV